MKKLVIGVWLGVSAFLLGGCQGGKQEIPLLGTQTYQLQSSGKLKAYASPTAEGAQDSKPLHKLRVKRKNEGSGAKTEGCWTCTDCICNGDDCGCTECTSC